MATITQRTLARRNKIIGYAFIFPAVIFLALIVVFPMIYNIKMSLSDVTLMTFNSEQPFIGLDNFSEVFKMPVFKTALKNTFIFTVVSLIFQFIIGFAIALLFTREYPIAGLSRGMLMVCWTIPIIVYASVWKWMFTGDAAGVFNYILMQLHIIDEPISYFTSGKGAMTALIITNIWRGVPYNMLLLATGLTQLPDDVFEAAEIDGANAFQRFFRITVPLLKPTMLSVAVTGFIYTFKTFDLIYIMTNGGPLDMTHILATTSYKLTFSDFEFGQGAAVANVMLVILMVIGVVYTYFIGKEDREM